jgi:hypothetical protein
MYKKVMKVKQKIVMVVHHQLLLHPFHQLNQQQQELNQRRVKNQRKNERKKQHRDIHRFVAIFNF